MTFNKLYCTLQKAGQSSKIIFHSSLSTSCVSEDLLKRRNGVFDSYTINEKCQASIVQRSYRAFSSRHRHIHISTCQQFCIIGEENNDSDKNVDGPLRKKELASTQNDKSKVNKSKSGFYKKRCFYRIRHQNLVWDGSNKQSRFSKYKMFPSINERNKELAERMLSKTHNALHENSELKSEKENGEVLKAQESSAKKVLTIDIFPHSDNNTPKFKAEDNINNNSKINNKLTTGIKNSYKLISSKEVAGNSNNNRKIENDYDLITKSTINDLDKSNLTLLKQNKVPMNGIILKKKYKPNKEIKNIMEQENSTDKKSSDNNMAFKLTKNSLQKQYSKERIQKENSNYTYANRPKLVIFENKDNLDHRKNISTDERKITVWNTINKKIQPQLISNESLYLIKLQNIIPSDNKNINLKRKYKFASSVNSITVQENSTDKKSTDNNMDFKLTKNSLQKQNSKERIQKENSNYTYANRPKLVIFENKDNLDHRKNISNDERKITVWNTINKKIQPQLISNESLYLIKLPNIILPDNKNINLNRKYKFASSVNSILRPVVSQTQMTREKYGYQLLPKNVNSPTVTSVNSHENIAQQMCQSNNLVMDNKLHLKSVNIGNSCVNERLQNSNINYPLLNVSRDKIQNKIKLLKDIHSANWNKKVMVDRLKCEIKSWKKCEYLKKVVLESTSRVYHSIMDRRRTGKITKNTIYTPKKKTKKKCMTISIPLTSNIDINKCQKTNHIQNKTNCWSNETSFSSTPDPILTLNLKYKKNHQTKYNDLLKRNLVSIYQEKFKRNPGIQNYDSNKEFQIENKSGVTDNIKEEIFKRNNFNKPDEKDVKVFMEKAKKVSSENKSSWVRYMDQMNDESKDESLKITEISAYPSGCLKKPEFIIESLPFNEEHFEEMKQITQSSISDSQTNTGNFRNIIKGSNSKKNCEPIPIQCNKINENLDSSNNAELTNKFKLNKIGMSKNESESLCDSKHIVREQKRTVAKKEDINHKNHSILCNSPLDQEHSLFYESFEEIGLKANTNDKINHLSKGAEKLTKAGSGKPLNVNNLGEFQTKANLNSKVLNNISCDCDSTNPNKSLSKDKKEDDQLLTNNIKVEVSNNIYEPPIRNIWNNQLLSKENKAAIDDNQHSKFTISSICIEENKPSKNNSFVQNQPECLRTYPSRQIKPIPMKQSAIEIFFDSSRSQSPVSKEHNRSHETQIEHLITTTSSKPESKNNIELYNNCGNQKIPCEIQKVDECKKVNNSCSSEQLSKDIKFNQSSFDQNVINLDNHLGNVKNTQAEILGEENTTSKDGIKKGLGEKVNAPLPILSSNEKFLKENLISSLESQKPFIDNGLQISQQNENVEKKNFQKTLHHFKQSNSCKIEDINEFKVFNYLKKSYPDIYCSNNNKKAFIDNIKEFFRTSCSYFKLFSPERKASKNNIISNSHHSMAKDMFHRMKYDVANSFRELNLSSKQTLSFPKSGKPRKISSMCSKPDFHQKGINCNVRGNETELLPPYLTMPRKEGTFLNENEEFKRRFTIKIPVSQKGAFSPTCKNLEHIPKKDSSFNDLDTGENGSSTYFKNEITNTDNNLGKINHHDCFLNKIIDKNFESFSVKQVTQQGSFCNINCKKPYISKNRLFNQKLKQKFAKVKGNNIKTKLNELHYSMNSNLPTDGIPNSVNNRRYKNNELTPFKCKIGQKPIMKKATEFKKDHNSKLYSDVTTKPRIPDKSNLLKSYQSIKKLRDKSNPESFWSNCLAKNTCTEDKLTCDEFLTYIKKRKLPRKPSFKCN